ncbi:SGNH/GDSL hydrolase family protein [Yoonia sp. GPGPB17]|uniref:SGNH/GDSL hydrolase family protein n=1 Tax=Yoonia sp. GPGPB17 TaxID=3026147 RepID=UPI0030C238F3
MKHIVLVVSALALFACNDENSPEADILAIGDSIIWWNIDAEQSVADVIAGERDLDVINAAIPGAEFLADQDSIPQQYQPGRWEWVVMDGGANDLGDVCGTPRAQPVLDQLIDADLQGGAMPRFFDSVRSDGPQIIVMGYYMAPIVGGEFAGCEADFTTLNDRLAAYAARTTGVYYAPADAVIDPTNNGHYDPDLIHPSPLGSRLIGLQMADIIRSATDG